MQQEHQARRQRYKRYEGPREYLHVKPERICRICGKPDWCSYTRNGEVSCCARTTQGADRISKEGWGIYFHTDGREDFQAEPQTRAKRALPKKPQIPLAPLEIRHAVYTELLRISPATSYRRELIDDAQSGLRTRGFGEDKLSLFGALPPTVKERAHLARELRLFVLSNYREYAEQLSLCAVVGIPGFWQDKNGAVQLWHGYDDNGPLLVIPYRDALGQIQACQVRRTGTLPEGVKRYSWLATPKLRNGVSSGSPIHFSFAGESCKPEEPILITEGALKAEAFKNLRPRSKPLATSGVGNSHEMLIAATRGRPVFIGFDADHRENVNVCRQLGRLVAGREQDAAARGLTTDTKIIIWDWTQGRRDKGIDDAALLDIHMKSINIEDWYHSLTGDPKESVDQIWRIMSYRPV